MTSKIRRRACASTQLPAPHPQPERFAPAQSCQTPPSSGCDGSFLHPAGRRPEVRAASPVPLGVAAGSVRRLRAPRCLDTGSVRGGDSLDGAVTLVPGRGGAGTGWTWPQPGGGAGRPGGRGVPCGAAAGWQGQPGARGPRSVTASRAGGRLCAGFHLAASQCRGSPGGKEPLAPPRPVPCLGAERRAARQPRGAGQGPLGAGVPPAADVPCFPPAAGSACPAAGPSQGCALRGAAPGGEGARARAAGRARRGCPGLALAGETRAVMGARAEESPLQRVRRGGSLVPDVGPMFS